MRARALLPVFLLLLLVGGTVFAASESGRRPSANLPPELTDKTWAATYPDVAPDIKKVQKLYGENEAAGVQAAVDALRSQSPAVRAYGLHVLGAVGKPEHLAVIAPFETRQAEPMVAEQAALAHLRIRVAHMAKNEMEVVDMLTPAFANPYAKVRLYSAQQLAPLRSEAARQLRAQVLATEKDPAVHAALSGH